MIGLPLAVYAKRLGKVGFHMGGDLQVLFGIKGKRYDQPSQYHYRGCMGTGFNGTSASIPSVRGAKASSSSMPPADPGKVTTSNFDEEYAALGGGGGGVVAALYNSNWVRPAQSETPENANDMEGGCYW